MWFYLLFFLLIHLSPFETRKETHQGKEGRQEAERLKEKMRFEITLLYTHQHLPPPSLVPQLAPRDIILERGLESLPSSLLKQENP